ncbi:MAG: thioredoxin domain-containing protein [Candidatus Nanopelagicales bacterium]
MTNRLSSATSPYLQQHKDNPVDWYPWGDEAFAEAKRRDVPVFLSIGYAACHWCHVMAHESFEDEATAAILNDRFVCIKVDREERPDVDAVYMSALQALTGQGGWPMSVFLDTERRPFHAGTYFPPEPRHGSPSFRQILLALSQAWTERRADVEASAERITVALASNQLGQIEKPEPLTGNAAETPLADRLRDTCSAAVEGLARDFDHQHAGFGRAPKFPPSSVLEFLLRWSATGTTGTAGTTGNAAAQPTDQRAIDMVAATCEAMARGGIYDQLAGGFARYSVDREWIVPHFEKMLYDNALLLQVYAHWYRATGSPLAERIARETAEFLLRDLRTEQGGFAASLDADAPVAPGGHAYEGASYAWRPNQLVEAVGETDAVLAAEALLVTPGGTFEKSASVLQLPADPDWLWWSRVRVQLLESRNQRPQPARDDKVVTAWNALAVTGLAQAGALLDEPAWIAAAGEAAELIERLHITRDAEGRLQSLSRTSRDGVASANAPAVLEDYGDLASAMVTLFGVTGVQRWLDLAGDLLDVVLAQFIDESGGFFDTAADAEQLFIRPSDPADLAAPSGWSAATDALLSYGSLMASPRHLVAAEQGLLMAEQLGSRSPRFAGWLLAAAAAYINGPQVVVIVGEAADPQRGDLHQAALRSTAPGLVVAVGVEQPDEEGPFLGKRTVSGTAAAYVCRGTTCSAPITDPSRLAAALN